MANFFAVSSKIGMPSIFRWTSLELRWARGRCAGAFFVLAQYMRIVCVVSSSFSFPFPPPPARSFPNTTTTTTTTTTQNPKLSRRQVNKPSLRQHYIGLHNESTAKRTAAYAAFVCFQRATEGGGRFLVADGAAILAELDPAVLERLYDRRVRISVSNLDIPPGFPQAVKDGIKGLVDAAVAPKFDMDLEMMYEMDGKPGRLQAVETAESPINRHPVTGLPVWFNNAHNHARKLRDRRPCGVPEVGMTEVFYADTMSPLDLEDCQEIKR